MNAIDVAGPMAAAFQNGGSRYRPVFTGVELDDENGRTATTLNNLNSILDIKGQEIAAFLLGMGMVLVWFRNGNQYLATGFGYGHQGDEVKQFADFAADQGFGNKEVLFHKLSKMQRDHSDILNPTNEEVKMSQDFDDIFPAGPQLLRT